MQTSKKPKFVAIATQKGGAGKTTFTVLVASMLQYKLGKNVAVIDCDQNQRTISRMRDRDIKAIAETEENKNSKFPSLFAKQGKTVYTVQGVQNLAVYKGFANGEKELIGLPAILLAERLSKSHDLDYVFFDLPGSSQVGGAMETLSMMDYIFCPFAPVTADINSSFEFCVALESEVIAKDVGNLKAVYGFWTPVNKSAKTLIIDECEQIFQQWKIPFLKTRIPQLERFKKEISNNPSDIFKSTVFPPHQSVLYGSGVNDLVDEMLEIMEETTN